MEKSKLALEIESRERKCYEFEVNGFFGLGDKAIHKIAIRANTKSEQDNAVIGAHTTVNQRATGVAESARTDDDLLLDAKTIQVLFTACRRCEEKDKEEGYRYTAFPGPDWMRTNFTTEQLAVLLNLYNEVRIQEAPASQDITFDRVEELARVCSDNFDNEIPEAFLAAFTREWLTQAFVLLSRRYDERKREGGSVSAESGHQEEDDEAQEDGGHHGTDP